MEKEKNNETNKKKIDNSSIRDTKRKNLNNKHEFTTERRMETD